MKLNNDVQETIVTYLKTLTSIIAYLSTSGEIKEDQWQGTNFVYPAIRVMLKNQTPYSPNTDCLLFNLEFSILVFTEDASSKMCDKIMGELNNFLHGHTINGTVKFQSIRTQSLVPAFRQDERTWRSEANYRAIIV